MPLKATYSLILKRLRGAPPTAEQDHVRHPSATEFAGQACFASIMRSLAAYYTAESNIITSGSVGVVHIDEGILQALCGHAHRAPTAKKRADVPEHLTSALRSRVEFHVTRRRATSEACFAAQIWAT